jgi:hypothetical protein
MSIYGKDGSSGDTILNSELCMMSLDLSKIA